MLGPEHDSLWYKDAVIYQLHVKTFFDANGDGVGDFQGLTGKIDYLARLGVTCLWLLPFYESPLRDDGYDVADYERINQRYGSLDDFTRFVDAAHARGLKVVTELVINHTSDQHLWFQAARRAPAGSPQRDFYVWSDNDRRFPDARIVFSDAESSNWTWDPVAGAYYLHRFFHHQPDLNLDNPDVRKAAIAVMKFWLDRGVDGLRLDAVPHWFKREGTSCENLPETHDFLREIRAEIDRHYTGRVIIAEANQSPEDTRRYFGASDECHMAFHFALMRQLFVALAREDRGPLISILERAGAIPEDCQWAIFLRSHDELTLSAFPAPEREWFLRTYAPEPRMRLNGGIRRRLSPLLGGATARVELAHALLLSMPGSPVMYYGDEIGMGDDLSLQDRDGLRTPMQWSHEVHGGFSRPDIQPVIPPIRESPYGYQSVNVAAQEQDPGSLLSKIRSLIAFRRQHRAFGRGSIELIDCDNPKVLAFARRYGDDEVVVIANLSRTPQTAVFGEPRHQDTLEPLACRWLTGLGLPARVRKEFVKTVRHSSTRASPKV